jgi:hypothetical protein
MSRLESHRNKQFGKTVFFTFALLVALVIFIFFIGIKALLSFSSFIANVTTKKTPATLQNNETNFFGTIEIDSVPSATNSAKIVVSGSVLNYDQLFFYLNDEVVKEQNTSGETFSEEIGDLKKGDNTIYITAKSRSSKKERSSKTFTVYYKNEKPKLEIQEPSDNSKISKNEISVRGSTDKETYIKINDAPIVVDANGNFQSLVQLKEGENIINISAQDIAGNTETKDIKVTYEKD